LVASTPHGAEYWEPPDLRLAFKCLVGGIAVSLLYVWTILMALSIFGAGPPAAWFWLGLGVAALGTAVALYAYETWERAYWGCNWHRVSEFADPPPWK
jgi:hypothetical protein